MIAEIEAHYIANRQALVKRFTFRSGSVENAEDIVQESYVRAMRYYRSYDGSNFDRWLSRILNNSMRDLKRQERGYVPYEYDEDTDEGVACSSYPEHVMREINELIDTKSVVQMEVLKLHLQQEYRATDIAKITDYSEAQCRQIIKRFRDELKELYG